MSEHFDRASALVDKIRALRDEIPRFVSDLSEEELKRAYRNALVPPEAVESASVAIDANPGLENLLGTNGTKMRDAAQFALAFESVAHELRVLARGAELTVLVQKAAAGSATIDLLVIGRRLMRQKDGSGLGRHVEEIGRKVKKTRARKKKD